MGTRFPKSGVPLFPTSFITCVSTISTTSVSFSTQMFQSSGTTLTMISTFDRNTFMFKKNMIFKRNETDQTFTYFYNRTRDVFTTRMEFLQMEGDTDMVICDKTLSAQDIDVLFNSIYGDEQYAYHPDLNVA